ncbi:hypothetical protein C2G38_2189277 [Gigaspora rosea]|uniref:Uncharacterized protein n=1 Tax=Gigaspora rosea TaxID=44941 RepID=A0A397V2D1_9GLOM|nr:hypothetical protein C2G38_2189277 [Gigaspora rosea]
MYVTDEEIDWEELVSSERSSIDEDLLVRTNIISGQPMSLETLPRKLELLQDNELTTTSELEYRGNLGNLDDDVSDIMDHNNITDIGYKINL